MDPVDAVLTSHTFCEQRRWCTNVMVIMFVERHVCAGRRFVCWMIPTPRSTVVHPVDALLISHIFWRDTLYFDGSNGDDVCINVSVTWYLLNGPYAQDDCSYGGRFRPQDPGGWELNHCSYRQRIQVNQGESRARRPVVLHWVEHYK